MSEMIPEGWSKTSLGKVCDVVGGGTPSRIQTEFWNGDLPWVSPTEITKLSGRYISVTKEYITKAGLEQSSAKLHPAGTVLMTSRASIGFTAINTLPMSTNQGFQSLRCKNQINNEFLHQYISWARKDLERLSAGSTFLEISSTAVKEVNLALPPLPEQKKIASILTSVDDVIEKTQAQIDKLKDLKIGMMQELLTKGIGHTEFKDSPVGRIPVGWEVKPLSDICSVIRDGTHLPPKRVPEGVPLLSVRNIQNGEFKRLQDDTFVTKDFYDKMHTKWKPEPKDLLIAVVGATIGKVCQVPSNFPIFTLQRSVAVIRGKEGVLDNDFLHQYAQSKPFNERLWDRVNQTAQPGIYLAELGRILVPIPPLQEQKLIKERIGSISALIQKKSSKLTQLQATKKALMQDLLTGKVRVNHLLSSEEQAEAEAVA